MNKASAIEALAILKELGHEKTISQIQRTKTRKSTISLRPRAQTKLVFDLKGARKKANLSLKELAVIFGFSFSGYRAIEAGTSGVSLRTAFKMSKFFETPVHEMWTLWEDDL